MLRKIVFLTLFAAGVSLGAVVEEIGNYSNWTTTWTSLDGFDADDGANELLDFVGDALNPGLYYANSASYFFIRMRVDADTYTRPNGAYAVTIDIANYGASGIDYAFTWDSKSTSVSSHGLEMSIRSTSGPTWGDSQLDDLDGDGAKKEDNDINGASRTTDGYVRATDGMTTTNFGDTTFIDYAVSWDYMETYTDLRSNQTWNIGLASIANATDHNVFNADVSGGATLSDSITIGWSDPLSVPEPATIILIFMAGLSLLGYRRISKA